MRTIIQIVQVLIPVLAGWALCRGFVPLKATGIGLACAVLLPAVGAGILRGIVGEGIGWRNIVGGWLLPWGYAIGRGKLPAIAVISGVTWAALLGLGIIAGRPEVSASATPHSGGGGLMIFLLVLAWAVDGVVLFYLAGMLSRNSGFSRPPGSTQAKVLAIVVLLIGISFCFWLAGRLPAALWIAGFPPLFCGTLFGAWTLLLVTVGRNARWN